MHTCTQPYLFVQQADPCGTQLRVLYPSQGFCFSILGVCMYVCRIVCVVLVGILLRSVCRTVNMHASYSNQRKLACHCTLLSDQSHFFSVSCVS
jgi:hypothetical protein